MSVKPRLQSNHRPSAREAAKKERTLNLLLSQTDTVHYIHVNRLSPKGKIKRPVSF